MLVSFHFHSTEHCAASWREIPANLFGKKLLFTKPLVTFVPSWVCVDVWDYNSFVCRVSCPCLFLLHRWTVCDRGRECVTLAACQPCCCETQLVRCSSYNPQSFLPQPYLNTSSHLGTRPLAKTPHCTPALCSKKSIHSEKIHYVRSDCGLSRQRQ